MAGKKDETVDKSSKTDDKSAKKESKDKKTLVDLVEASDISEISIIMDLSMAGLLDQYYEEINLKKQGMPIIPSLTEAEFKKIIGD